jgi:hypothetical protein
MCAATPFFFERVNGQLVLAVYTPGFLRLSGAIETDHFVVDVHPFSHEVSAALTFFFERCSLTALSAEAFEVSFFNSAAGT